MTPTEAADLIMRAGERPYWRFNHEITLDVILAAVATVMDAARADALEEAAAICESMKDWKQPREAALKIRNLAQSHRETKP